MRGAGCAHTLITGVNILQHNSVVSFSDFDDFSSGFYQIFYYANY